MGHPDEVTVYFKPQPDITAFELATIMSKVIFPIGEYGVGSLCYSGVKMYRGQLQALPEGERRHFSEEPPDGC